MMLVFSATSQVSPCYFDEVVEALDQSPFDYGYLLDEADDIIATNIQVGSSRYAAISSNTSYEIPVVVHVLHKSNELVGVGSNISSSQIDAAIAKLNADFANAQQEGVDINVEFCLASRDPDGNPSTGVNRIDADACSCNYSSLGMVGVLESNSNEIALKALSKWPNTEYINIWTVSEINGNNGGLGIQGFATPPGTPDIIDGLVVLASSFTANNTVTTHEMGHFFSLYHTFQGDQDGLGCPPVSNTDANGDRCQDTPPHRRSPSFTCNLTGTNTCYNIPNSQFVKNYLDYSSESCHTMFTDDQRMRIRCSLMDIRYQLMHSVGCLPPCPGQIAGFETETNLVSTGIEVEFTDISTGSGSVSWFVNDVDETPTTTSTDFKWTFTQPGRYFVCQEKTGGGCFDRVCMELNVIEDVCSDPPINLPNGDFESFAGDAPTVFTGIPGRDFINFQLDDWNVFKGSPDFFQTDGVHDNFVRVVSFPEANANEGIFACYDFVKDREYLVCLDLKSPSPSNVQEIQVSLGNNFLKAVDFVASQSNPKVGDQVVFEEKKSDYPIWTSESFTFIADKDYNNIAFASRCVGCPSTSLGESSIYIDNIQISPFDDDSGFTVSQDREVCLGEIVNLIAEGGSTYSWSPASSLTCSDCPNPIATPSETTTYTVDITYGESCPITVSRDVTVTVNCGTCDAIPSFTDTITDCKVKFTGINSGDPGEFIWDFGDGTVAAGPVVEHEYQWGGDFEVCLTIKCDFDAVTICDSISISSHCDNCTSVPGVNSQQCTGDSLNTYLADIDFIVPAGLEPCTGDGLFIYSDDVNIVVTDFGVVPINSTSSQVLGNFELNTTDQAGFEANGTTIYISLCDSLGVMQCFSTSVSASTCDVCTEVSIPLLANCDPNMSSDSMNFYIDTFSIPGYIAPPFGNGPPIDITSSIVGFSFTHLNGEIVYTINTDSDLPLTEQILVSYTNAQLEKVCVTFIIQTPEPCFDPLPENCVANWDPKPVECTGNNVSGYAEFDYDMTVDLGPYELCDGELSATLEGGMVLLTNSSIVGNQLSFTAQLLVPGNFAQSSSSVVGDEYILRIYLCDDQRNVVCYGFPLDLRCAQTSSRSAGNAGVSSSTKDFLVYPNPVQEIVKFSVGSPTKENLYEAELVDMNGSLYQSISLDHTSEPSIDVSSYPSGVYIVRFKENDIFIEMKKLIIIH